MKSTPKITNRPAIGYTRVSSERQAREGVSLDAQFEMIISYCDLKSFDLEYIWEESGASGRRVDNRPALEEAVAWACEHRAALVVHSLSRLTRSTIDFDRLMRRLHRHGAALVSLTEDLNTGTPMGRAIAKIIAVMAELESEQIGQRVRHALAHLKATGGTRRPGSKQAPFGFQYDAIGRLNRLGVEQRAIRKMVRLRMERRWTFGQIAEAMERGGPPLRTGKAWTARTVSRIVHRAVGDAAAVHDARRMNYRTAQRLRRDFRTGRFSFADLAARYNIDRSNAWRIAHGHAWNTPRPFAKRRK